MVAATVEAAVKVVEMVAATVEAAVKVGAMTAVTVVTEVAAMEVAVAGVVAVANQLIRCMQAD
jgi:hypothetical protein